MNELKKMFAGIHASERLKRRTKARLRKKTFDYGRDLPRQQAHSRRVAGALAALALTAAGAGSWFLPVGSIALDINPSLELQVNAFERVTRLKGLNHDGLALAEELDVAGMPCDEAMQRILLSDQLEGYLENGSLIAITVAGMDDARAEEVLSRVVCRAYAVAGEENIHYCRTDVETEKAARAVGLCVMRYQVWQRLLQTDPHVTVETVAQMPKEELLRLAEFEKIDNPCGE